MPPPHPQTLPLSGVQPTGQSWCDGNWGPPAAEQPPARTPLPQPPQQNGRGGGEAGECMVLDVATATLQHLGVSGAVLDSQPVPEQAPDRDRADGWAQRRQNGWGASGGRRRSDGRRRQRQLDGSCDGWDGRRRPSGPASSHSSRDDAESQRRSLAGSDTDRRPPPPKPAAKPAKTAIRPAAKPRRPEQSPPRWATAGTRVQAAVALGTPGFGRTAAVGDEGVVRGVEGGKVEVEMDSGGVFMAPAASWAPAPTQPKLSGAWIYSDETTPESDGYGFTFTDSDAGWDVSATQDGQPTQTKTTCTVDGASIVLDDVGVEGGDRGHVRYTGTLDGERILGRWVTVSDSADDDEGGGTFECRRC
eukprot:TRINITY_DN2961_c5_g1_i1.p2 TRINITY_DN2961_c5_g1~~TRINITY_DN2961_c5_g1_i1.p2  ORF type:complete len:416 (+),score=123.21 TRINITY_DN2961_c5_g1_i1:167-1249(+)